MRTFDHILIAKAISQYADEIVGFDPLTWTENQSNVALINDNEDIALFERLPLNPVAVFGHYFFWSRGKEAVKAAKHFLEEIFNGDYNVKVIIGLTPVDHKAALWMNRQLGFTETEGILPHETGDVKMVTLTKQEWSKQ